MTGPAVDPLADYQPSWRGQADPLADYHPAWKSAQLVARMQRDNANDADAAAVPEPGYVSRFTTHLLNTAQGIPGMEAVEAAMGALGSHLPGNKPMGYTESLNTLRDATGHIGGKTSAVEHIMGSLATLPFLPKNPTLAGGLLGGADQALSADPNESIVERAGKTAIGAGAGALTGRALDKVVTAGRAILPSRLGGVGASSAENVVAREGARDATANVAYGAFRKLGDLGRTPELEALIGTPNAAGGVDGGLPVVRTAINTVKGESPRLAKLPDTDAAVLDAVYKRVGTKAFKMMHGAETGEARQALLDAIDGAAKAKGFSYADIVSEFKNASRGISAVQRGSDLVKGAANELPAGRNLSKVGEVPFAKWLESATPAERDAVTEGILGGLRSVPKARAAKILGVPVFPVTTKAMSKAPGLLRMVDPNASRFANYGLLGVNALSP